MYLGMALHQLSDYDNAAAAYDKAVSLEPAEPLLHLNYGKQVRASLHALTVHCLGGTQTWRQRTQCLSRQA
jgi:Flp pilus assembly protein TadD